MQTLQDIVNGLPAAIANRYSPDFWIRKANQVLRELEMIGEIPRVKEKQPFALLEGFLNYKLPSHVNKVLGVTFERDDGSSVVIDWQRRGQYVTLLNDFSESDYSILQYNGTVEAGINPSPNKRTFIARPSEFDYNAQDNKRPFHILFLSGRNANQAMRVSHVVDNGSDEQTVILERDLLYPISGDDTYEVYEGDFLMDYVRPFSSYTEMACSIVEDEDIFMVVEAGLRYHAELQTDEEGEFALISKREYDRLTKKWFNRHQREFKNKRRYMPRF